METTGINIVSSLHEEGNIFSSFNCMPKGLNGYEHNGEEEKKEHSVIFFHSELTGIDASVGTGFQRTEL